MFLNAFAASSSSKGNRLLHSYMHLEGLYFCRHDDSAQIDAYYLRAQTLQHSKNYEQQVQLQPAHHGEDCLVCKDEMAKVILTLPCLRPSNFVKIVLNKTSKCAETCMQLIPYRISTVSLIHSLKIEEPPRPFTW